MLTTRFFPAFFLLLSMGTMTQAQFTCTMGAQDEDSCVNSKGDDGKHCAWCSVAGFGACVSEDQAETMEQNIPGTQCDRYSGGDDDATTDDAVPSTDDEVSPTDDSLPDDYWTCLRKKDTKSCTSAGCSWCDSKQFGFGVCMTGPSAESAADSDFFECTKGDDDEETAASVINWLRGKAAPEVQDPTDSACLVAFLQDPSEDGCSNAVDSEGNPCFFCSYQGFDLCLNEEQVQIGEGFGMECKEQKEKVQDPTDPTCLMAFLQDPTPDGCNSAVDQDGNGCVFCTFQGSALCLNEEQAQIGEQFGLECNEEEPQLTTFNAEDPNPYDPTCAMAFLQDQDPAVCKSTVDMDGEPCKFCTLQGTLNLCLTDMQAEVGEGLGIECGDEKVKEVEDPTDPSCLMAFLQDPTTDGCNSAVDQDGNGCVFCTFQGNPICLNQDQAAIGEQFGLECTEEVVVSEEDETVELPPDVFDCLQNYDQDGCDTNGCTWCNTEVGVAFCAASPVARSFNECSFFDCDTRSAKKQEDVATATI